MPDFLFRLFEGSAMLRLALIPASDSAFSRRIWPSFSTAPGFSESVPDCCAARGYFRAYLPAPFRPSKFAFPPRPLFVRFGGGGFAHGSECRALMTCVGSVSDYLSQFW